MASRKRKKSGHDPAKACPYKGEPGYVRGRLVRDPARPGWLLLYDRLRGAVPGMDKIVWNEHTRWVVMWRPLPGQKGKVLFRALASEELGDAALTWAAKGCDQLRLWDGREPNGGREKTPVEAPKEGDFRACAHNARPWDGVEPPRACAHEPMVEKPVSNVPPPVPRPPPGVVARIRAAQSREALADDVLLGKLPLDTAMAVLADIAQGANKAMVSNGTLIDDLPDHQARLKALELYAKLLLVQAAQREKEQVVELLDDSHLYRNFFESTALRDEIERMKEQFAREGVVTTQIPGDPMVC